MCVRVGRWNRLYLELVHVWAHLVGLCLPGMWTLKAGIVPSGWREQLLSDSQVQGPGRRSLRVGLPSPARDAPQAPWGGDLSKPEQEPVHVHPGGVIGSPRMALAEPQGALESTRPLCTQLTKCSMHPLPSTLLLGSGEQQ